LNLHFRLFLPTGSASSPEFQSEGQCDLISAHSHHSLDVSSPELSSERHVDLISAILAYRKCVVSRMSSESHGWFERDLCERGWIAEMRSTWLSLLNSGMTHSTVARIGGNEVNMTLATQFWRQRTSCRREWAEIRVNMPLATQF